MRVGIFLFWTAALDVMHRRWKSDPTQINIVITHSWILIATRMRMLPRFCLLPLGLDVNATPSALIASTMPMSAPKMPRTLFGAIGAIWGT